MQNIIRKTLAYALLPLLLLTPAQTHSQSKIKGSIRDLFSRQPTQTSTVTLYTYKIVNEYPHNPSFFTQGFFFHNDELIEGTGLYGNSSINRVAIETGKTLQTAALSSSYFGEGITVIENKIVQLTWLSGKGFVYDLPSLTVLQEFTFPSEGWGLTHNRNHLIASDGTSTLYFLDRKTFKVLFKKEVYDKKGAVSHINELEYVKGRLLANIWGSNKIAVIDPRSGRVTAWIDLTGLLPPHLTTPRVDVLNGIAYDEKNDRLFVTGKYWPRLFEIKLVVVSK